MLEVVLHIVLETLSEAPSSFHRERTLARKAVLFSVFRNLLFSLLHMTFSCVIGCYKNAENTRCTWTPQLPRRVPAVCIFAEIAPYRASKKVS